VSIPSMKTTSLLAFVTITLLALPAAAEAQRRGPVRGHGRIVVVSGSFGYPSLWYYDQWGPWGPWGPYGPGGYGPYRPYPYGIGFDEFAAAIKFDVDPKDAEVYVDGALAGEIDDFDGIFQSLRVRPGTHEVVVYKQGYRSYRDSVYIEPYHTRKMRFDLEKLGAGEAQEARPQPAAPAANDPRERARPEPPQRRVPEPRMPPPPPERREPEARPAQFGTLSIRVVPSDAEIFVDGERWTGPTTSDRLSIQLSTGRHSIQVKKPGLGTYTEDVLIRQGATLTLNVSLK